MWKIIENNIIIKNLLSIIKIEEIMKISNKRNENHRKMKRMS